MYFFSLNVIPFEEYPFHNWGYIQNYKESKCIPFIWVVCFTLLMVIDPSLFIFSLYKQ